ncbi:MAG: hypothetical protein WC325_03230 [Candidatus Bathyarchaeia archaeon]|jgi:hypothetical protein
MKRKRILISSLLIFLGLIFVVQNIQLVNANFIPYYGMPTKPTISVKSPIHGETYSENSIQLIFEVKEPEVLQTGLGEINWIAYSIDDSENVYVTGNRVVNETDWLFTIYVKDSLKTLLSGEHKLNVSVSSTCRYNPNPENKNFDPTTLSSSLIYFRIINNSLFHEPEIPEFTSWILLPLFLTGSLVIAIFRKKLSCFS